MGGQLFVENIADLTGLRVVGDAASSTYINTATGTVAIGSLSGGGSVVLGSRTLELGGLNSNDTISGVISDTGPAVLDSKGGVYAPAVTDKGGSLVKTGTGQLTLTGANTYTGGTTITGGALQLGDGVASGSVLGAHTSTTPACW